MSKIVEKSTSLKRPRHPMPGFIKQVLEERGLMIEEKQERIEGAMSVKYLTPDGLHKNPAFSQVVATEGNVRTVYVGGQNAVSSSGKLVGKGNMRQQASQVFKNLEIALSAAGARLEHVIKWNVYVLQGQPPQPAFEEFQRVWGNRPNPPLVTVLFVAGLVNPDFLLEIDAIAVISGNNG